MGERENTGSTQDLKQFEGGNTGKAKTGQSPPCKFNPLNTELNPICQ